MKQHQARQGFELVADMFCRTLSLVSLPLLASKSVCFQTLHRPALVVATLFVGAYLAACGTSISPPPSRLATRTVFIPSTTPSPSPTPIPSPTFTATPSPSPTATPEARDIVEVAAATRRLTLFVAGLQTAGLMETLRQDGPYTVFAPVDAAFNTLPASTLQTFLRDPQTLAAVLRLHIVPGKLTTTDLKPQSTLISLATDVTLPITQAADGTLYISNARILTPDIPAANGVIHLIDAVLEAGALAAQQSLQETEPAAEIVATPATPPTQETETVAEVVATPVQPPTREPETVAEVVVTPWSTPTPHLVTPIPPAQMTETPVGSCTVLAELLNIRRGPDVSYPPIRDPVPTDTRLEALARSPDPFDPWVWVRLPETGELGWVAAEYLACDIEITDLPIPPLPTPVPRPDAVLQVHTLLVGPGRPGRVYALLANEPEPLWMQRATRVHLLVSDDLGETWTPFSGGLPVAPSCMINISMNFALPDALYASTCQGIYAWNQNRWEKRSDIVTNLIAIHHEQPHILWAAIPWKAVIRSLDGGQTWQEASYHLANFGGIANLLIDPIDPQILYAIIRPKFAGSYLRRGAGEGYWATLPTPEDNMPIDTGMAVDRETGTLYVTSREAPAQLWRTPNPREPDLDAIIWERVQDFGDDVYVSLLGAGWSPSPTQERPSGGPLLFANFYTRQWLADGLLARLKNPTLHRSLDGGKTWEPLTFPLDEH